jgi:hypothetical protein
LSPRARKLKPARLDIAKWRPGSPKRKVASLVHSSPNYTIHDRREARHAHRFCCSPQERLDSIVGETLHVTLTGPATPCEGHLLSSIVCETIRSTDFLLTNILRKRHLFSQYSLAGLNDLQLTKTIMKIFTAKCHSLNRVYYHAPVLRQGLLHMFRRRRFRVLHPLH